MLQNSRKTLGFKKNMVYKIPPGGGGKPYPASGLLFIYFFFGGGGGGCPDHLSPSGSAHRLEISNCPLPRHGMSFVGAN